MASRRRRIRRRKGNTRKRVNIDRTTALEVGREAVIVHGHPTTVRGMTTRVPGVHPVPILITQGKDHLHIRPEATIDADEIAVLGIPPDGVDQKTTCCNGRVLTSPTRFTLPGDTTTGLNQATTTGSDSGVKVRAGGHHHRRGRGLARLPQPPKPNRWTTVLQGWLRCRRMPRRCQVSVRTT